jgi:NAD(P)-dependent dehydrogenase (short-subunit alcohol dehydrogenase family)
MKINFVGPQYFIESLLPRMDSGSSVAMIASIGGSLGWTANLVNTILPFLAVQGFEEKVKWLENNKDNPQAIGGAVGRPYAFSKECLIAYAKQKAWVLAERNIRMNTLSPGSTCTPMLDEFGASNDSVSPICVSATPEDQAKAMIYLNSDYASYVSGTDLIVDFGFSGGILTGMKVF